jgi:DNA-binding response OmpR family regulator
VRRIIPPVAVQTRVLVIDDESAIRLLCRVNLEAEGMEVLEAADGVAGVALARAESPDVVILDVTMPELDGWQVAEELQAHDRTRSAAIVFLTGRAELRERANGLGIDRVAFLTKPFDPTELADVIRELLTD